MRPLQSESWRRVSPGQSLLFVILIVFTGFLFIGPLLGFVVSLPFYNGTVTDLIQALGASNFHASLKLPLFIVQGTTTLVGFIVLPLLYTRMVLRIQISEFFNDTAPTPSMSLVVMVLVVVFMFANSVFIEWNANVNFPEFLSGLEQVARQFEENAQKATAFLTSFDAAYELYISLIVIAVLPAIGEEFVFRGIIQNHIHYSSRNVHVAIWVSAFIFSFFHMQFFGFVPRLLLGALFGYIYAWSGNLAYPIIAHFFNNGFTLVMLYLYRKGAVGFDIESTEPAPMGTLIFSMVLTVLILFFIKKQFNQDSKEI